MKPEKEKWVESVLSSIENIQRAKPDGGFYQKTIHRINAHANISTGYVLRIAAGFLLLITLNVFACASFSKNKNNTDNGQLQAFAKEYSINSTADTF